MATEETKRYFKLLNKLDIVTKKIMEKGASQEEKSKFALCLAEIHSCSSALVDLINKISETNISMTEKEADDLLGNLTDVKIYLYTEITDWVKDLKKPLKKAIDQVADMCADDEED